MVSSMPWTAVFMGSKKSSGFTRDSHFSANRPSTKCAIPIWQMLSRFAFAVSTSSAMNATFQEILGVAIRKVTIPVAAGRNLAVLVEAAVRNFVLNLRGIDSTREFIERQQRLMDEGV